jgi:hypothetical protein
MENLGLPVQMMNKAWDTAVVLEILLLSAPFIKQANMDAGVEESQFLKAFSYGLMGKREALVKDSGIWPKGDPGAAPIGGANQL